MSVELVTTSTCSNQWSKAKGAAPFDVTANPVVGQKNELDKLTHNTYGLV
jgi:hypothetical protein